MGPLKSIGALRDILVAAGLGCLLLARPISGETLRTGDPAQDARLSTVNPVVVNPPKKPSQRTYKVVIDPGHGGKDKGAQGHWGISEHDVALRLSRMVKLHLNRRLPNKILIEARLTRETDKFLSLLDRARVANDWNADVFVSVHANSSPFPKAHGFELYFLSPEATDAAASRLALVENSEGGSGIKRKDINPDVWSILSDAQVNQHINESSRFAESVFQEMTRKMHSNGRAVRQAPFTVLHGTSMPSILIEIGYVTHLEEAKNLLRQDYLIKAADAISSGIEKFLTLSKRVG